MQLSHCISRIIQPVLLLVASILSFQAWAQTDSAEATATRLIDEMTVTTQKREQTLIEVAADRVLHVVEPPEDVE